MSPITDATVVPESTAQPLASTSFRADSQAAAIDPPTPVAVSATDPLWPLVTILGDIANRVARQHADERRNPAITVSTAPRGEEG